MNGTGAGVATTPAPVFYLMEREHTFVKHRKSKQVMTLRFFFLLHRPIFCHSRLYAGNPG